jgi:hypothetical protein
LNSSTIESLRSQEQSYLTIPGLGPGGSQGVTGATNHERRNLNDSIVISPNDVNDFHRSTENDGSHLRSHYWLTGRENLNPSVAEAPFDQNRKNVITPT